MGPSALSDAHYIWFLQSQWALRGVRPSGESAHRQASSGRTHGFAPLADHPASSGRGHSDVGFQLHLLFGVKEVFFFQFPKDPPLSLRERDMTDGSHSCQPPASALWLQEWGASSCTPSPREAVHGRGALLPPPPKTALTLNWASGGPVMMTILSLTSGPSAGAICRSQGKDNAAAQLHPEPRSHLGGRHTHQQSSGLPPLFRLTPASSLGHRKSLLFGCPGRDGSRPGPVPALSTSEPGLLSPRESKALGKGRD